MSKENTIEVKEFSARTFWACECPCCEEMIETTD
ncbi:unnamed protein product, partial [marine sediment metagenome]